MTDYRDEIAAWFDAHRDEMLADLSALIAIPSVYAAPEPGAPYGRPAADALALACKIMEKLGIATTIVDNCFLEGDICGTNGEDPKLGILAHVDVVAANAADWQSDPFTATIRDGKLYGRGATDNKGPAVASIYAAACALDICGELTHGVRLLIGSAEEQGCIDIDAYLQTHTAPPLVFSPDAGYPIANVEKGRFVAHFRRDFAPTDAVPRVTSIHGGATENIVPPTASATLLGLVPDEITAVAQEISAVSGVDFTVTPMKDGAKIFATGTASHASSPQNGANAQTALLALLNALPLSECDAKAAIRALSEMFPHGQTDGTALGIACYDDIAGALTLSFDVLTLDEKGVSAAFDSRSPAVAAEMGIVEIAQNVLQSHDFCITRSHVTPCHHTPADSELVRTLLAVYSEHTGDANPKPFAMGGSTYVHNVPGGVAFGTARPGEDNRIHGRDEFIGVAELFADAAIFTDAILRICR